MGSHITSIQQSEGRLCGQSADWWLRFRHHTVLWLSGYFWNQCSVVVVHSIPDDRCCMGSHVGHAVHFCHQCPGGIRSHGCLSWTLQWHHLCTSDCSSSAWRRYPLVGRFCSEFHDGSSRRKSVYCCYLRIRY